MQVSPVDPERRLPPVPVRAAGLVVGFLLWIPLVLWVLYLCAVTPAVGYRFPDWWLVAAVTFGCAGMALGGYLIIQESTNKPGQ
jgi:hypothetical protein